MTCNFDHELDWRQKGFSCIAGIDEAGRGALAGPVVAAAVALPEGYFSERLNDSKKLSARVRESLYQELTTDPRIQWAVAAVDAAEVDRINVLQATHVAMRQAVLSLPVECDFVLIDGLPVLPFPIQQQALVGGDGKSFSIAAASVLAKVTRDRFMIEMDVTYPQYEFVRHKGYATAAHLAKLREHGPCPIHRKTFEPVAQRNFNF